jgi:hypothetical protein
MFTKTLQKRFIFMLSFQQFLGGNPFWKAHGCPTEDLGHDGKDNNQEATFNGLEYF